VTVNPHTEPVWPIDLAEVDGVDDALDRALVSKAVEQLSPSDRHLIRKAHHLGWTTQQIAAERNVSDTAVKRQLHDAMRSLRLTLIEMSDRRSRNQKQLA
jgi:RNA polymerase sigma factor (sigma-70 family)